MFDFNKPNIEITDISDDKKYGRFVVEPLERGYGTTLGNSLRRIMLSSLPGSAISQVKIDGVLHEFSSIPGVKEDVTEIIMNLKSLAIKNTSESDEPKTAYIEFEGEGVVTAADIQVDQDIEIMNPETVIATLNGGADSKLYMELTITNGRGYVSADKNKNDELPIAVIPIDSIYTPVERVNLTVENTRVGQITDFDKLTLDVFTNGTLVDDEFCEEMRRVGNLSLSISLEGFEEVNDMRRGEGVFDKVMAAMDRLKKYGLIFGTSICYTRKNIETVTSDEFLDMIIGKGCRFTWYFHYMPVGNDAAPDLLPTKEQREYMYHRVREIRGATGGKPIYAMDFQNDGEFVGGCIAGGRNYCHINANGDVEPCVFIHYSSANIREVTLLEALKQPLFMAYRDRQPFNSNHLRPCPMLENPEILQEMIKETGAKSTDLQSPESAEHLCSKCKAYACEWKKTADQLWKEHPHQQKGYTNYKKRVEKQ